MENRFEVKYINSKYILVDQTYQRKLDQIRVSNTLKTYDDVIVNLPKLSYRDEKFYVFNGQHTVALLKAKNNHEDLPIMCIVYEGLTQEQESKYFREQNGTSRQPTINDHFHAAYNYGDDDVTMIVNIAKAHGFTVDLDGMTHGSPCCIRALRTLLTVYRKYGATNYEKTLSVIKEAWNGSDDSTRKEIISGVALFCHKYNGKYNRQILVKKLSGVNPIVIIRDANATVGKGAAKYAKQILQEYNKYLCANRLEDELS